ncbi:threonine-phosphate decarboxylase CobD [Alkalilimnicola ehrlichii MLHE-1]|uniref:threonine-phosphate decarboxylase n=1 Tax=Alkalilimnicola ehrlichii (strain ATCC BAA-1101 / DSM 17681 / MLHE-1) TaxID=187272 RepID=Q0A4S8_ALKEH|nr:threonine-phosphate decarboxylase CobD [Alkalilimnicola ehrlichii]ABI58159.1 aminotransferase [Alkalilimnicola ehrlichii MLHE-1]
MAPDHGGGLRAAASAWGRPPADWLDLSTGISPWSWPVPAIPTPVWQRLPEPDGLPDIARTWAGAPEQAGCLPVPGTQAVIQRLPHCLPPSRVGVPHPGYAEHAHCWRQAGHHVIPLPHDSVAPPLETLDVLVWINPNNPTGRRTPAGRLAAWHRQLAARSGLLVVDEAFIDTEPVASLATLTGSEGLLVLRSLGKFFGLAGLRAGLVFGPRALCARLDAELGPWAVSHPARWVMARALADRPWQVAQRYRLAGAAQRLADCLAHHGLPPAGGTGLFQYCPHPRAATLHGALAARGILTRHFAEPSALRFGLPGQSHDWRRLEAALRAASPDREGGEPLHHVDGPRGDC